VVGLAVLAGPRGRWETANIMSTTQVPFTQKFRSYPAKFRDIVEAAWLAGGYVRETEDGLVQVAETCYLADVYVDLKTDWYQTPDVWGEFEEPAQWQFDRWYEQGFERAAGWLVGSDRPEHN